MRGLTAKAATLGLAAIALAACGGDGNENLTGEELAVEIGCFACHEDAATDVAPTLQGVWNSEILLEDGRTVIADEAYVMRAITDPGAEIVAGYDARMPTFGLSEGEVDRLVDYVRSLE